MTNESLLRVYLRSYFFFPAQSEGQLRLVNSPPSTTSGRLEIFLQGQWGTVCDDDFERTEAAVACRQLGFTSAIRWERVGLQG